MTRRGWNPRTAGRAAINTLIRHYSVITKIGLFLYYMFVLRNKKFTNHEPFWCLSIFIKNVFGFWGYIELAILCLKVLGIN